MIQIIDGFKLNASTPIDSRFVVADVAERMAITYLYHGLRVWQLDTNIPYFYDGTQWISELDLVVTGSGTLDSIPKIIDDSPVKIGDSQISDDGSTVTITNDLDVGGEIKFNSLDGVINADKITTGILSLNVLQTGTDGYVLQMDGGVPKWNNLSGITIGTSENAEKVEISPTNTSIDYRLILREAGSFGFLPLYSNSNGLRFEQDGSSNLRILAHDGAVDVPSYSFDSSDNSGIYYLNSDSSINVSINGVDNTKFDLYGLKTKLGSKTNPSISSVESKEVFPPGPSTIVSLDDTGFYFDVNYNGLYGAIIKSTTFVTGGDDILSFDDSGLEIHTNGNAGRPSIRFAQGRGIYINTFGYMVLANGSNDVLQIENGAVVFGDISTGSPRIRTGDNTDADKPSYTWWGNDKTGIYRPSSDVIGVSIDGEQQMELNKSGIQMMRKTYTQHWVGRNSVNSEWIYALDSVAQATPTSMPSEDCDRFITINLSNQDINDILIYSCYINVENGVGTNVFYDNISPGSPAIHPDLNLSGPDGILAGWNSRQRVGGFNDATIHKLQTISAFVPAGCKWRANFVWEALGTSGDQPKAIITIQRFGFNDVP